MSNKNRTVVYIGYTNNIARRLEEHKTGKGACFTRRYNVFDLVYLEVFDDAKIARRREKQLKNWHKDWKWNLIKESNPGLEIVKIK